MNKSVEVEKVSTNRLIMPLEVWLAYAHTSPERALRVRELIEQDLSGTHPFRDQGVISFYQRIATVIARKIA